MFLIPNQQNHTMGFISCELPIFTMSAYDLIYGSLKILQHNILYSRVAIATG